MIFSQSSRPIRLIKIVLPVFVLLISTLACSFSSNNNNTSHEATAAALNQTAVALSVQATQLAEQQNQNNPAKPVEQQPTKPAPPAQPPQVAAPTQPPPTDVQNDSNNFYIVNDSDFTICYFYLSLSSNSDWGVDQLEDNLVYPGETFTLYDVPYGTYDLNAQDCDNNLLYEEYNVSFPPNDTVTLFNVNNEPLCGNGVCGDFENPGNCPQDCGNASGQVPLTIVNQTSEPICYVWIGVPESEWLGDILESQMIEGWGSLTVYVNPGEWALSAEDCSGDAGLSQMKLTPQLSIYGPTTWYVDP